MKSPQPDYQDNPSVISTGRNKSVIKILMLEDNVLDYELISRYLKSSAINVESFHASSKEEYIQKLEQEEFDVILADHSMPDFNSFEALAIRNKTKFHIPFILVSGTLPEEYAATIIQEGANDYILKDRPHRLATAITEAIKKQKIIADKLLAEKELIKANETLNLVGRAAADAMWDYDVYADKIIWGEGYEKLFGNISELPRHLNEWLERIHPADFKRIGKEIGKALKNKKTTVYEGEYKYMKADGDYAIVRSKALILRDNDGNAYRAVGVLQDITHVRQLEMRILEQNLQIQKHNTEIVIQAQEEERKQIGKELHDNINQLLSFSKMMIDAGRQESGVNNTCIDKGFEGICMAIGEVRKLSHALVPPGFIDGNSFTEAVNHIVTDIHLLGNLKVDVNILPNFEFKIGDEKIKLTIYRIIQEQVNNILKYAKATKASITLKIVKNKCRLIIADNGVGFDINDKPKGIGLRNIESRVCIYTGTMEIISSPRQGCKLKVTIPVN